MNSYFNKIFANLDFIDIWKAHESHSTMLPFWQRLENVLLILVLKILKVERMANFYFKLVDWDYVSKEIKKLYGNEACQRKWYRNQNIDNEENIDIICYILDHSRITPCLTFVSKKTKKSQHYTALQKGIETSKRKLSAC